MRMKWLKKWRYLSCLIGVGMFYLARVDRWQIYAEPLREARSWCAAVWSGGAAATSGAGQESEAASAGSSEAPGAEEGRPAETGEPEMPAESGETEAPSGDAVPEENDAPAGEGDGEPAEAVYTAVEDSYFEDALFIGDSRTVGLEKYSGLKETAAFYAATGLTVYRLFDTEIVPVPESRKKLTVEEALQTNSFAKIYLMVGINEMGTGTAETFLKKYQEAVDHLRELQPDAVLYLQGIIRVTAERSAKGDFISNEGIEVRNEGIAQMADGRKVFYLDVNPLLCDESGGLAPEYTFDGVHLKAKYMDIWEDYLKTHAISP